MIGKTSFARVAGVSLSEQVVLSLLKGYENKGHIESECYHSSGYNSSEAIYKSFSGI